MLALLALHGGGGVTMDHGAPLVAERRRSDVLDRRLVRGQRGSDVGLLRGGAVTAHDGRAVDAGLA